MDVFLCVNKEVFIKGLLYGDGLLRSGGAQAPCALWSLCSNEETLINIPGSLFLHDSDKCTETQEESVGEFTIFASFSTCWVLALAAGGWVELL